MKPTPNTTLYLLENVDLDPDYNYTIDFDDVDKQVEFFIDKKAQVLEYETDYSYIRDNETLKVQVAVEDLLGVNYLMYKNSDKWFFAFITRKDYVNPNTTRISFKLDVYQSFMFDYELQESFIDREHQDRYKVESNMLKPIYNIEPENLEVGSDIEVVRKQKLKDNNDAPDGLIWVEIVATQPLTINQTYDSSKPETWKNACYPLSQMGVSSGIYCYLFPTILGATDTLTSFYTYNGVGDIVPLRVDWLPIFSESNAVLSMRVLHYSPIKYTISSYQNGYLIKFNGGYGAINNIDNVKIRLVAPHNDNFGGVNISNLNDYYFLNLVSINNENINNTFADKIGVEVLPLSSININTLKNIDYETKLKTHPYQFRLITDYQSNPLIIKNEYIDKISDIKFIQSVGVQSKFKIYVDGYNNDDGKEYNATNNTINELPLKTDAYKSYMSQNKASATSGVALNIASGLLGLGLGVATGGIGLVAGAGMALNTMNSVGQNIIKMQDLKNTPDNIRQAGNNAEFDIIDKNYQIVLSYQKIKNQHFKKLYQYFYHYGYKCNEFKKPNLKSRYYFNFIKTIGSNIKSNIDAEFKQELKQIFDNGVTIWHHRNKDTFKGVNNYDYENAEMSLI